MMQLKANHMSGFTDDCSGLLAEFTKHRSPDFRHFCDAWKRLNFQYIFYGYKSDEMLVQFIEDALNVVKQMFIKSQTHLDRIGTIYLLYALFFKQPTKQFCKLRFTMEETTALLAFHGSLSQTYNQARLIFWKLVQADAFRFVECEYEYGFERYLDRRGMTEVAENSMNTRIGTTVSSELTTLKAGLIPALKLLEFEYNKMKEHLDQSADRRLLPATSIVDDIESGVRTIEQHFEVRSAELLKKRSRNARRKKQLKESLGDAESSDDEPDNGKSLDLMTIGDRRAMLKSKGRSGEVTDIRGDSQRVDVEPLAGTSVNGCPGDTDTKPFENGAHVPRSMKEYVNRTFRDPFGDTMRVDENEELEGVDSEDVSMTESLQESEVAASEGDAECEHKNIEKLLQ